MYTQEILIFFIVILFVFIVYSDKKSTDQLRSIKTLADKTFQSTNQKLNIYDDRIRKLEFSCNETFIKYGTNKTEFEKVFSQLDMLRAQLEVTKDKQYELRNDLSLRKPIIKMITQEIKNKAKVPANEKRPK